MGGKSLSSKEQKNALVSWRIPEDVYERLKQMVKKGDCSSINEAARRVLSGGKIKVLYIDDTFNLTMERLCEIRSELKSIELNINQVTRCFNSSSTFDNKLLHSLKILEQYHQVGTRVEELLLIVSKLAKKWLHS